MHVNLLFQSANVILMGLLLCNVMSTVIALAKMDSKAASVLFLVSSKNGIEYLIKSTR